MAEAVTAWLAGSDFSTAIRRRTGPLFPDKKPARGGKAFRLHHHRPYLWQENDIRGDMQVAERAVSDDGAIQASARALKGADLGVEAMKVVHPGFGWEIGSRASSIGATLPAPEMRHTLQFVEGTLIISTNR